MHDISPAEIVRALLADTHYQFQERGDYLRKGLCPACGKRTLYVGQQHPWVLRCERLNKCGYEVPVRGALPEVFSDFARRYPPTAENHHATADAYLALDRGFDLSKIRGWYEQAMHQIPGTADGIPTVRFYLDPGRTRWWERLIGRTGKNGPKALFGGAKKADGTLYAGDVWSPPDQELQDGDTCYIVEGIFHAIALHHCGVKAVAAFSCSHFPTAYIESNSKRRIKWVVALDSDKAGQNYSAKHHARLKELGEAASVCLLPAGQDWDDLYRAGRIEASFLSRCVHNGRLALAPTVQEKAYVHYLAHRRGAFLLDFHNALYSITLGAAWEKDLALAAARWAEEAAQAEQKQENNQNPVDAVLASPEGHDLFTQYCAILQISNVLPRFLYMERDALMDDQRYVFSIAYANGQGDDLIGLEGTAITSPDCFHKALLNRSRGGTFDGDTKQLKILRDGWLNGRMLTVSALPFIGYDRDCGAWIFQEHAWHNGRCLPVNEHGYYDIGGVGVKTVLQGVYIHTGGVFDPAWLPNFARAFHWQGMATLAYWLGSLFVQQIRARHKTFPFLELTGEPGAGKSTILEFLWKCVGRDDYEGFDLLKATAAGRRRAFSQVSNLPVVIIESDRDSGERDAKQKQFSFDEVKPFYNGRGTGTLGVARRSNDVEEHLFQASLVISQNAEVDGSEALLQRIVHCHADKGHHRPGTREIARWFERQTSADVGGFLGMALAQERQILATYEEAFERIEAEYTASGRIKNERIIKNHAQVAACGHALKCVFPNLTDHLRDGLTEYLLLRAKAREVRLAADHPLVEQFWDVYDYISGERTKDSGNYLNHASQPGLLAINLNQYRELAQQANQPLPDMQQLKRLLPQSKRHKLIEANRTIRSRVFDKSIKCWIFQQ